VDYETKLTHYFTNHCFYGAANEPPGVSALKEPGESKTKTSAKVVLPAVLPNIDSSDHRDSSELSSIKGSLLGLANYNSDYDDDDSDDDNDKPVSNLSSETNAGTANPEKTNLHMEALH
jgi:beta-arabinofuranosyltransferase